MKVHNPNNLPTLPITDLLPTQGDLKDLTEANYKKLKNRIETRGFIVPVFVWEDKKGILHLLDGHQRRRVLETEGWDEPVPYLKVPADTMQEAMAKLLEITSQYGTITQEGVDTFIAQYELDESEVFEATSFDAIKVYGTDIEEPEIDLPSGDKDGFQQMTFTLADQQADEVRQAISVARQYITGDEINENGNGNALYHIARVFNERS